MLTNLKQSGAIVTALLLLCGPLSNAQARQDGFVDSVYEWGSWDLGIEPAAGGPIPAARRPVNVQQNNLKFRPNDNNKFTSSRETVMTTTQNGPTPLPPGSPAAPPSFAPPGAAPGSGTLPGR